MAQFRVEGCDSIVAIGGGSPMDAAKAAAARLARPNRSVGQLKGLLKVRRKIVPFAAVPTTAGTGSETTIAAVVTDETHHKYAVNDLCLIPRWAILDPTLPVMLEAYGPAACKRLAELADVLGLCPTGSRAEKARAFIDAIYRMNRALSIPERFPCIRPEDLPQMAAWAEAEANPVYPVPVIFGKEDFIRVARRVML